MALSKLERLIEILKTIDNKNYSLEPSTSSRNPHQEISFLKDDLAFLLKQKMIIQCSTAAPVVYKISKKGKNAIKYLCENQRISVSTRAKKYYLKDIQSKRIILELDNLEVPF